MRIAIIGSGSVGSALARAFAGLGHRVTIGKRDPEDADARTLANDVGADVAQPREAARQAEVVVLAVPGRVAVDTAGSLGDLAGKIVLDATNAVGADLLPTGDDGTSQVERIAVVTSLSRW